MHKITFCYFLENLVIRDYRIWKCILEYHERLKDLNGDGWICKIMKNEEQKWKNK
jgi:hypothetical protein